MRPNTDDPGHDASRWFVFWQRWLVVYSMLGIVFFGVVMTFGSTGIVFEDYNRAIAEAFWGQSELP